MRLAFSSLACPGWAVEAIVEAAHRFGYDGVEWRLADGALLSPRTDDSVWERIESSGVASVCLDTSCAFVNASGTDTAKAPRRTIAMAERAVQIGAPAIRVFGGRVPEGSTRDAVLEPARDALAQAARGLPSGIAMLVETHDDWSRGSDIAPLVDGIDGVGVLWDVAHSVRAGESPQQSLDHIGSPGLVHMKDAVGESLTHLGDGEIPLGDVIRVLRDTGYDGWLSVEWEKLWHPELDEPEIALPRAASHLRGLLDG